MQQVLPIIREAANRVGGMTALARSVGLSRSAIYQWKTRVPAERVITIEAATGISRERLRPDLYANDIEAEVRAVLTQIAKQVLTKVDISPIGA